MVASYGLYTTIQGQTLTASTVYSSLSVFDLIREQMFMVTWLANTSITAVVSIRRLNEYLNKTELLDRFEQDWEGKDVPAADGPQDKIEIRDASFTWNKPNADHPGARNFRLKIDHLSFEKGKLNIVAGSTGSGKTS
jgi:ABC-type multidrug transport system fused ATPase/permease subunit